MQYCLCYSNLARNDIMMGRNIGPKIAQCVCTVEMCCKDKIAYDMLQSHRKSGGEWPIKYPYRVVSIQLFFVLSF